MKQILSIAFLFLLAACGPRFPKDILPPETMGAVLWQLMLTDEYVNDAFIRDSTHNINTERIRRYRQVFQLHQTSKEAFEKSYSYYMAHPELGKQVFDTLNARFLRMKDTLNRAPHMAPVNRLNVKPVPPSVPSPIHPHK